MKTPSVLLFGEILVDVFPDRGVLGGAPFNVARHLQAFGLHPLLISRTGNDALRDQLITAMTALDMDTRGIQLDTVHPTGRVQVHMEKDGHRFEILPEQAYDFIDADTALKSAQSVSPELIYFGTLAQRLPLSRRALDTLLADTQAPRFLDINLREPWYEVETLRYSLSQADIVKLNIDELRHLGTLLGLNKKEDTRLATAMMKKFAVQHLLVTCGGTGAWLMNSDGTLVRTPSEKNIRLLDTVGAGDGFTSVFILGMFRKWPFEKILLHADAFAGAICEIRGAVPEDDSFYEPFRKDWRPINGDP